MAGWSQNRRGSGIWELTPRAPSTLSACGFLHDDGGRYGVIKVPFGAHPCRGDRGVGIGPFGNRHRAGSRIPPLVPIP